MQRYYRGADICRDVSQRSEDMQGLRGAKIIRDIEERRYAGIERSEEAQILR